MGKTFTIGTRGSELALIQAGSVREKLLSLGLGVSVEIKIIKTEGDRNMNPIPFGVVGKRWFTKEIERELSSGEIDMAVHSLKDLSSDLPDGLVIAAYPARDDSRDALVARGVGDFRELDKGATVGTDSARRKSQILHMRPDIEVRSVRGNVNTRLRKLDAGEYGALILAVAGLKRLGLSDNIAQYMDPELFVPAPGQGALAVEIKSSNEELKKILAGINDTDTETCVVAERAFSRKVGGDCKTPVGSYAAVSNGNMVVHGMVAALDGSQIIKDRIEGQAGEAAALGEALAERILKRCPDAVLKTIGNGFAA